MQRQSIAVLKREWIIASIDTAWRWKYRSNGTAIFLESLVFEDSLKLMYWEERTRGLKVTLLAEILQKYCALVLKFFSNLILDFYSVFLVREYRQCWFSIFLQSVGWEFVRSLASDLSKGIVQNIWQRIWIAVLSAVFQIGVTVLIFLLSDSGIFDNILFGNMC